MRRNVYLLKIEAKSFRDGRQDIVRIQRVIWDHLQAFKGEIIQRQALFSLPCRKPNNSRIVLIYAVCSVFPFVLFSTPPRSFFHLNHVRKAWNRCSHSRFSSQAIILGFFDRNVASEVYPGCQRFFFSLGEIELSGEAAKVSGKAARKALLALKLLTTGEREDLCHPGYSKSGFVKRFLLSLFCVIRDFIKGHFIDDSNKYKFIYVPSSSSSEKNTFSMSAGFLIFSSEV